MTNNTLNTQATELLETTTIIRDNKKVQLLQKNAIIKTYLSELNDYINNNVELMINDKKYLISVNYNYLKLIYYYLLKMKIN